MKDHTQREFYAARDIERKQLIAQLTQARELLDSARFALAEFKAMPMLQKRIDSFLAIVDATPLLRKLANDRLRTDTDLRNPPNLP